jgi:hypothetical protein
MRNPRSGDGGNPFCGMSDLTLGRMFWIWLGMSLLIVTAVAGAAMFVAVAWALLDFLT